MSASGLLAVGLGAVAGAWLRWLLGLWLNAMFLPIPPGTLGANLIGGYVIGFAVALFMQIPGLAPEWRLFVITGFCGGLTTFSTFSAEITALLQKGQLGLFAGAIALHVFGSLGMTLLGMVSCQRWLAR